MINIENLDGFLSLKLNQLSSHNSERVIIFRSFYNGVPNENLGEIFSILHSSLNDLFIFMNYKNTPGVGGHYNAYESRRLLDIIEQLRVLQATLKDKYSFEIVNEYKKIITICRSFLSGSGGSTIPDDFPKITLIEDKPIFSLNESTIIKGLIAEASIKLKNIGGGSYAKVYKYRDPHYGCYFVIKRANKDLRPDELKRFKDEFKDLKGLDSPFIVKAYHYNEEKNEYTMEYANETIGDFISRNNNSISFDKRRVLVIQLLKAFDYIHNKGLLHRDISYQNILVSHYDDDSSLLKVSDFGLVKRPESVLTRKGTDVKGIINDFSDLMTVGFENYEIRHETYAIAQIIYYILTGRQTRYHREKDNVLKDFILRGISADKEKRFSSIKEIREELLTAVFPNLKMEK